MPDIRDVLKGLSVDDRALYSEVRTVMRRAYLSAHAKLLPIDQYEAVDDAFLDLIDIKIATLFDRAGVFNHSDGHLNTNTAKDIEQEVKDAAETAATRLMRQPTPQPSWGENKSNGWAK
jgi:hypothetical protein